MDKVLHDASHIRKNNDSQYSYMFCSCAKWRVCGLLVFSYCCRLGLIQSRKTIFDLPIQWSEYSPFYCQSDSFTCRNEKKKMEARTGLVSYYVLVLYVHMETLVHINTHSAHHKNPHTISIAIQTNKAISITPDDDGNGDGPKYCRSYCCRRSTLNNILIAIYPSFACHLECYVLRVPMISITAHSQFRKTNKLLPSSMERVEERFSSQSPPFRTSTNTDRIFMEWDLFDLTIHTYTRFYARDLTLCRERMARCFAKKWVYRLKAQVLTKIYIRLTPRSTWPHRKEANECNQWADPDGRWCC